MKSIIQKKINISQYYLPMAFNGFLKAVDHVKSEGQIRSQHV